MTDINYCEGCGVELQSEEPNKVGFIPPSSLEKEHLVCQRCFRIKNYNEVSPVTIDENEFVQILNSIGKTDSLVIQIVDLFDIDGTLISGLHRFIGNNKFVLVANKIDLLPKSIKQARIKHWLSHYVREHSLKPEEIFLISAEKNIGMDDVAKYIEMNRNKRDVYVVGATNVGKSSFINRLIKGLRGTKSIELTTSKYPGTTLNTVRIPIAGGGHIIDTPGVVHKDRYSEWVSPTTLKEITPKKIIKPMVFQLNGEQTLFIGGLARIDQTSTTRNSFVFYIANELNIHRTKLNKAAEIYEKHLGELLSPPTLDEANTLPKLSRHSFKIEPNSKTDIVISGLGWISISGESATVDVYAPKGIGVHSREALI